MCGFSWWKLFVVDSLRFFVLEVEVHEKCSGLLIFSSPFFEQFIIKSFQKVLLAE